MGRRQFTSAARVPWKRVVTRLAGSPAGQPGGLRDPGAAAPQRCARRLRTARGSQRPPPAWHARAAWQPGPSGGAPRLPAPCPPSALLRPYTDTHGQHTGWRSGQCPGSADNAVTKWRLVSRFIEEGRRAVQWVVMDWCMQCLRCGDMRAWGCAHQQNGWRALGACGLPPQLQLLPWPPPPS